MDVSSIFNLEEQQKEISNKVIIGLERISEVFRSQLWEYAKSLGLSPIQIRILIFIAYHKSELCNVSYLAQEFNVTKPTISDAIKVLAIKKYITKKKSEQDARSYAVTLTKKGKELVVKTENFTNPIKKQLEKVGDTQLNALYSALNQVIFHLHQSDIIKVQRDCLSCRFFEISDTIKKCNYLKQSFTNNDLRLDCPEFEKKRIK